MLFSSDPMIQVVSMVSTVVSNRESYTMLYVVCDNVCSLVQAKRHNLLVSTAGTSPEVGTQHRFSHSFCCRNFRKKAKQRKKVTQNHSTYPFLQSCRVRKAMITRIHSQFWFGRGTEAEDPVMPKITVEPSLEEPSQSRGPHGFGLPFYWERFVPKCYR